MRPRWSLSCGLIIIEHVNRMQDSDQTPDFYEVDVPADAPGVAMRRRLKKLSDAEQG